MNYKYALMSGMLLLGACSKDDDKKTPFTLNVTPKHHGRAIDSCTIYIKYNAIDAPTSGVYDDSARCRPLNGAPVATFSDVARGNHFLYAYGWDPQLSPPKAVKGGFAYPDNGEDVQSVELAVSEEH